MAKKPTHVRWIIAAFAVALLGVLVYSSMQQTQQRYEVCLDFRGASHCATAAGATKEQAVRSAQEINCEMLAHGRDETMVCMDVAPASIRSVK
jgi:hypothetical protein